LKTAFTDLGLSCEVAVSSIATGTEFEAEALEKKENERIGLRHKEHVALVELQFAPSDSSETQANETPLESEDQAEIIGAGTPPQEERLDTDSHTENQDDGGDEMESDTDGQQELIGETVQEGPSLEESEEEGLESRSPDNDRKESSITLEAEPDGIEESSQEETSDSGQTQPDDKDTEADAEQGEPVSEEKSELIGKPLQEETSDSATDGQAEAIDAPDTRDIEKTVDMATDEDTPKGEEDRGEATDQGPSEEIPLGEPPKKAKGSKRTLLAIGIVGLVVLMACFFALVMWGKKPKPAATTFSQTHAKKTVAKSTSPTSLINEKLERISGLRDQLLSKQKEIAKLKQHYQDGIEETKNDILREIHNTGITSLPEALKNKQIEFGLRTIQRRQLYIRQLDQPAERLFLAGEDLLYLKRKTEIEMVMLGFASGIDMAGLVRHLDEEMAKHSFVNNSLSIDLNDVQPESLRSILKKINAWNDKSIRRRPFSQDDENRLIWREFCAGNFTRKLEVTELSPEAAKCLSEWQGKDLALNALTGLTPEAAKSLCKWQGEWLSLNGITRISPETARSLSKWQGKWLSLNGVTVLSSDAARYLSRWGGKQLELIGLQKLTTPKDKKLRLSALRSLGRWEKTGGRLFVPDKFRKQIEKIMRH